MARLLPSERWLLLTLVGVAACRSASPVGESGVGREATAAEVASAARTVFPSGRGLPAGQGSAREGEALYAARCSACHGAHGEGGAGAPALVGGRGTLGTSAPLLTVGSYWPTATTVFDYVRRAMPYQAPGTLSDAEVYALTAWLLAANDIVAPDTVLDAPALTRVRMPNRDGFERGAE